LAFTFTQESVLIHRFNDMIAQAIIGQLASHYQPMLEAALVALAVFEIWQVITMVASGINFGLLSRS